MYWRYPVPLNLEAKDLKSEIKKALSVTQCVVGGHGNTWYKHSALHPINPQKFKLLTVLMNLSFDVAFFLLTEKYLW